MSEPIDAEVERAEHLENAGALLRALGTDLERDGVARLEIDGETLAVDPPGEVEVEVEVEAADGEAELEVELSWEDEDGDTVRAAGAVHGEDDADGEPRSLDAAASRATFELFQDRADEWRWRLRHDNGNVIADSGEGYASLSGARNGMESVMQNAPVAGVERED